VDLSAALVALVRKEPVFGGRQKTADEVQENANRSDDLIRPPLPALRVQGNRNVSASSTNHSKKRRRTRYEGPVVSHLFEDELSCATKEFLSWKTIPT
jgi:hypothetical protein